MHACRQVGRRDRVGLEKHQRDYLITTLDDALGRTISYAQAAPVGRLGRAAVMGLPTAKNRGRIVRMTFYEVLEQVIALLQRHGRVSYCVFTRQFALDDTSLKEHL